MFRVAYRYVKNNSDAGSIVNTGFYKIFNNIDTFIYKDENKLLAWMKKIVINEALMFLRNKKKIKHLEINDNEQFSSREYSDNNLLAEDYYTLITELPEDLKTVFNLYAIDGYSHKEISDYLNITESSSRVYLSRARKILQEKINPNGRT